jgi:hypothetical protein
MNPPYIQYLSIAVAARIVHIILNTMIVGRVFTVEVHISARLDTNAKIYNHHHCIPNKRPGTMIVTLVMNAKNSTVFALFQYSLCLILNKTLAITLN